jgi:hypothetical protein
MHPKEIYDRKSEKSEKMLFYRIQELNKTFLRIFILKEWRCCTERHKDVALFLFIHCHMSTAL